MAEPSAAPGTTRDDPRTGARRDRLRRSAQLAFGFAVSYGLVLTLLSDVFFWLAIPGLLGLITIVIITLHLYLHRPFGRAVPYATDGTDRKGPVRHHYAVLTRRYLLVVAVGAALVAAPLVLKTAVAYPLLGVGIVTLGQGTRFWLDQFRWMRKCARVLKVYDFEFRSPVQKLNLRSQGRRSLALGADGAPRMAAREPLSSGRWPREIAEGVWFAGDEPFGGAILVPDTGELMCVQPENWSVYEKERREASAERRERAARAGLARRTVTA